MAHANLAKAPFSGTPSMSGLGEAFGPGWLGNLAVSYVRLAVGGLCGQVGEGTREWCGFSVVLSR